MDCLGGLELLSDKSINLIVTSPPYNVDLGNNKYNNKPYDEYEDNKEYGEYLAWLKSIFEVAYHKLTDDGRVVINIGDGKNGAIPTSSDTIQFMKDIGYKPYSHIIWDKKQTGNRAAFGSFCSPSCPSFPSRFEHILVFYKKERRLTHKGISDLSESEFVRYTESIWEIPPETKLGAVWEHPAMFPEKLAIRCLKMFSYIGDVVCDPFSGSGTTCKVAQDIDRNFIGFEISEKYYQNSLDRLEAGKKSKKIKLF